MTLPTPATLVGIAATPFTPLYVDWPQLFAWLCYGTVSVRDRRDGQAVCCVRKALGARQEGGIRQAKSTGSHVGRKKAASRIRDAQSYTCEVS